MRQRSESLKERLEREAYERWQREQEHALQGQSNAQFGEEQPATFNPGFYGSNYS
jgi:hypothetical protein